MCTIHPGSGVEVVYDGIGTGFPPPAEHVASPAQGPTRAGSPPSSVGPGASAGSASSDGGVTREERWRRVRCIEGEVEALLKEVRAAFFGEGGREMGGKRRATGVASLVTCILGFRCMLRRISIELWMGLGSP